MSVGRPFNIRSLENGNGGYITFRRENSNEYCASSDTVLLSSS